MVLLVDALSQCVKSVGGDILEISLSVIVHVFVMVSLVIGYEIAFYRLVGVEMFIIKLNLVFLLAARLTSMLRVLS